MKYYGNISDVKDLINVDYVQTHPLKFTTSTNIYGSTLPSSPEVGQVFFKTGTNSIYGLPTGGTSGQILKKDSSTNGDASWASLATQNNTTQYYVAGINSSGNQIYDTGVYVSSTAGQLNATSYKISNSASLTYDSELECLSLVFS